jgi:putative ABC transport system permease protein
MRVINRWQKRVRALVNTEAVDRELDEELAFHLEMETNKYLRAGMTPEEAKRQAKLAFGAVPKHRAETKEARWMSWFPDLSLDFRLGARMLVKYPGITIIGGLAMTFAIWVGCVTFEMVNLLANPSVPLPDGDRLVQISVVDAEQSDVEPRVLTDFITWRQSMKSVENLGAYRSMTLNLVTRAGDSRPIEVAEMSATGFVVASTQPLMGRTLMADDERSGAPSVVVIGHDVWRSRFGSAPDIIGRNVQLGEAFATIVGVMPEGFEFPVAHDAWTPLRIADLAQVPRGGPGINVFGKLPPGISLEEAQTELSALGQRAAVASPLTHKNLQPKVVAYTAKALPNPDIIMTIMIPGFAIMLLVLVCGNVALLMFARAATRESELIVRSALGASRRRIVIQLFAEALVLGGVAAALGLAAAEFGLRQWGTTFLEANMGRLPFWIDVRLSPLTVLYAIGLTILAAIIAGVLPALKVTRGISSRLRQATAGAGGLKFGGVWTAVIITQVAFTTAFPAMVLIEQRMLHRVNTFDAGFAADEYLSFKVAPEAIDIFGSDSAATRARRVVGERFIPALERLRQRVASEPGVLGVTFVDRLPRDAHREGIVELDDDVATKAATTSNTADDGNVVLQPFREVQVANVDAEYFNVLKAPIISGRAFQPSDFRPVALAVIVDQGFVDQVLHGRNPIGRRFRFIDPWARARGEVVEEEPWIEIVGVVKELGMGSPAQRGRAAGVYLPVTPGHQGPTYMVVHAQGDPMSFVPQMRTLATSVDPTLQLSEFRSVDKVTDSLAWVLKLWLNATVFLTAVALMLSLAGIYAVMSFTVSRRTREIGIRVALGANARSVVGSIFKRPLTQVAIGVAVGGVLGGAFLTFMNQMTNMPTVASTESTAFIIAGRVALLIIYSAIILGVCLLACVVPTRRALAVQPVEALRTE